MEFETIYRQMKADYEAKIGGTIADEGDFGMRLAVIAGEMTNLYRKLDLVEREMLPQTASGSFLDRHAAMRGISRKGAKTASGLLTFSTQTAHAAEMAIPQGTLCASEIGGDCFYETEEEAILPAGETSVSVKAHATAVGREGNIGANRITVLVQEVAGIDAVTNEGSFSGGCEEEDDAHLRERLLQSYLRPTNGANAAFYEELAMTVEGVWSAKALYDQSANRITLLVANFFRDTPQSLLDEVAAAVEPYRELNTTLTVQAAQAVSLSVELTVYVENLQGYEAMASAVRAYLNSALYDHRIGQDFNPYNFAKGLSEQVDGYREVAFTRPTACVSVADNQIVKPGSITIHLARKEG